jgi:transglutaminase-like putative cysteine protease
VVAELTANPESLYLLEQRFRYTYENLVLRLRHRLMVVPPAVHGGQYRTGHGLNVSGALVSVSETSDSFGNHVIELGAPAVTEWIEFHAWALVGHRGPGGVTVLTPGFVDDGRLLAPTPLTEADDEMADAAGHLAGLSSGPLDLAERICAWTRQAMTYKYGTTGVHTTAATALAGREGVCQDFAHLMLAVSRAAGLPARYVSGHLIGEGGSHAWVEVIVNDRPGENAGPTVAVAFDPTHDRRAHEGYFTVAVGRDYADVAPTSGTFAGTGPGVLSSSKQLSLADQGQQPAAS